MKARKLVVGERVYWYSLRHLHEVDGPSDQPIYRDCRERVTIRLDARGAAPLHILFKQGLEHSVGDGDGSVVRMSPEGTVRLNLHRPGVVRAMLDAAIARGWDGVSRLDIDGWDLCAGMEDGSSTSTA